MQFVLWLFDLCEEMFTCCMFLSCSTSACVAGGRVDVPAMTRILQGRMKEQTTSHDELRDAFQVGRGTILLTLLGARNPDFTLSLPHYMWSCVLRMSMSTRATFAGV